MTPVPIPNSDLVELVEIATPPSNIHDCGTPYFTGREEQLKQIHQKLHQKNGQLIVTGMGGIGKTELALQYALSYQKSYPGGLFWLKARRVDLPDLDSKIVSFGRVPLNLTPPENMTLIEQVAYCWQHWPTGKVLIVLDNMQDYRAIAPHLPPVTRWSKFKILMTSRQRPGPNVQYIDLNLLSPEAALRLLRSLIGSERIEEQLQEAEYLCKWLGNLPLGLELVGSYLNEHPTQTVGAVLQQLQKKGLDSGVLKSQSAHTTAKRGVSAAFDLSWDVLTKEAQHLGCWLSLFAHTPLEWTLVKPSWQPQKSGFWGRINILKVRTRQDVETVSQS